MTMEDLAALPILTKADVQDHAAELVVATVDQGRRGWRTRSGTTGGALRFRLP